MKKQKRVLISGGTSGFGLALALKLAALGAWEIIICGRSVSRGQEALRTIKEAYPTSHVHFFALDLGDFQSIRDIIPTLEPFFPLDALVNCAALQMLDPYATTAQGYNAVFGVNHLGTFALSYALLPHLGKEALIITLSSNTHIPGKEPLMPNPSFTSPQALAFGRKAWQIPSFYWASQAYTTSKLCNVLFTYALRDYLHVNYPSMRAIAFDPGMMPKTNLIRSWPVALQWLWKTFAPFGKNFHSGISCAETSASILLPHFDSPSGKFLKEVYFSIQAKSKPSKDAQNRDYQKALWDFSLREYNSFF